MGLSTFIVVAFYVFDEWLVDKMLIQRGPIPTLYDSEVLTIEMIG